MPMSERGITLGYVRSPLFQPSVLVWISKPIECLVPAKGVVVLYPLFKKLASVTQVVLQVRR